MDDYLTMLKKARAQLPKDLADRDRWSIPVAELIGEGRMTVLRNFGDMVKELRREPDHLAKYLLQQIGTAGQIDGDRLIFTGKLNDSQVMARVRDYVSTYVQCSECGSPDTKLVRQERVQMLSCEACGAASPVKARKGQAKIRGAQQMREGAELEVTIKAEGSKGAGQAEMEGYTVIVPKTPVGETVKVKIVKIQGKIAFGERIDS